MDAYKELVREVVEHFLETAEWPRRTSLQLKFRHLGKLEKIIAESDEDLIRIEDSNGFQVCSLTFRGFAQSEGMAHDMKAFLHAVRSLAKHYIESEGPRDVLLADMVAELNLSELELRRLREIISEAHGIWSGLSSLRSDNVRITPTENIWYFEEVYNMEDFDAAVQRKNDEERAAARLQAAKFPMFLSPVNRGQNRKGANVPGFINSVRLTELNAINSAQFDLTRLLALCEELNLCWNNGCVLATAVLTRAIIDHVPPIFGVTKFSEVASNYPGTKSFRDSMRHLENSARKIGDAHLHSHIRSKEVLPTTTQVDFSRDLDVLLGEIVRILR